MSPNLSGTVAMYDFCNFRVRDGREQQEFRLLGLTVRCEVGLETLLLSRAGLGALGCFGPADIIEHF